MDRIDPSFLRRRITNRRRGRSEGGTDAAAKRNGGVSMLSKGEAVATIGVKSTKKAKGFYEGVLGLQPDGPEQPGVLTYKSGGSRLFVYESQYAGTNKATAATWTFDDVEGEVEALKKKGVKFEHYDLPNLTRRGDLHVSGNMKAAWFKDPDGNILALVSG
jgi:catechol 2,3-dioxygenase-like lactoylglutathione lyase family enzyme